MRTHKRLIDILEPHPTRWTVDEARPAPGVDVEIKAFGHAGK